MKNLFIAAIFSAACALGVPAIFADQAAEIRDPEIVPELLKAKPELKSVAGTFASYFLAQVAAMKKFELISASATDARAMQENAKDAYASGQTESDIVMRKTPEIIIQPAIKDFLDFRAGTPDKQINRREIFIDAEIRILDAKTGKILFIARDSEKRAGTASTAAGTETLANETCAALAKKLAVQMRTGLFPAIVASVDSARGIVVLNTGKNDGILAGTLWTIFDSGDEIKDPATGKSLGSAEIPLGKIRIVSVQASLSVGKFISEDGLKLDAVGIAPGQIARQENAKK